MRLQLAGGPAHCDSMMFVSSRSASLVSHPKPPIRRSDAICRRASSLFNLTTLCSPNEDFERTFRSTFQHFVAQILYSHPWKVSRRDVTDLLFCLPKSSFGEHKVDRFALTTVIQSAMTRHCSTSRVNQLRCKNRTHIGARNLDVCLSSFPGPKQNLDWGRCEIFVIVSRQWLVNFLDLLNQGRNCGMIIQVWDG